MNTIIINEEILNQEIPKEMMPKNLTSATDLLLNVKHNNIEGMLVLNTSPDIWKTWYNFYDDENKYATKHDFKATTYKELIKEYEEIYNANARNKSERIECAKKSFKDLYKINDLEVIESDKLKPFYQLRYSKTFKLWTLYRIEFFIIASINGKENILKQNTIEQEILPFDHNVDTLFKNMPITEAMHIVLKDSNMISELKKYIIEI